MVYVCLLPLNQFIVTVEKLQYSRLSHYVSFIKITGITALCMSLNLIIVSSYDLINYSLNLKERKKQKTFYFLTKFIEPCLLYMLVVLHFTNNSSSFCYSYIASAVPFQFIKKLCLHDFYLSC